jgi:hypothetical protein
MDWSSAAVEGRKEGRRGAADAVKKRKKKLCVFKPARRGSLFHLSASKTLEDLFGNLRAFLSFFTEMT